MKASLLSALIKRAANTICLSLLGDASGFRTEMTAKRPAGRLLQSAFYSAAPIVGLSLLLICSATAPAFATDEVRLPLATEAEILDPHAAVYAESQYPSANACASCHQQIYEEWASSNHAYASISPMFHKFEQAITTLTQGTIGTFCVRCHQQIGTQLAEKRYLPLWERSQISREGITCITCHRVAEQYGKVNGERNVAPGDIHTPVAGMLRESEFQSVLDQKDDLRIAVDETERGTPVHSNVIRFQQISESEFCVSCHQVAVNLGIKLEVVWDQYRDSPAYAKGDTCQDCHMGAVPGVAAGYTTAPSAIVNGEEINPGRRHSNHAFYGPGYTIAHPGIFPHNPDATAWDIEEWLMFDYRGGWGTEDFELAVEDFALAFDDLHVALEPLGGGLEMLWGLDAMKRNIARGVVGFEAETGLERMLARIEPMDGVMDPELVEDAIDEALTALDDARSYSGDLPQDVSAALDALEAQINALSGRAGSMSGFDDAYAAVVDALEGYKEQRPDEAGVVEFTALVDALQATIPGAHADLQEALVAAKAPNNVNFPFIWADAGDREDAWSIVEVNIGRLEDKLELRRQVMENGSRIDGPFFDGDLAVGEDLAFHYTVTNIDEGHNLPSGSLGAQPEIWLNVALVDPDGETVWESGYVDKNGDFVDMHSLEYAEGTIEYDDQIFNLQTKFLTTNVKGTDREMYLPVSFDIDQRPFLRPAGVPTTILNHAPFVRMEARSIPPLGSRDAEYTVPGELITKPGKYRLAVRMRSRAEPIYFMRFVGATADMEQSMNEWMLDIHPYAVEFDVQ